MRLIIDNTNPATNTGGSDAKSAHHRSFEKHLIDRRRLDAEREECQPLMKHQNAPAESATDTISAPHSHPVRAPSHGQVEPQRLNPPKAAGAVNLYSPWSTHREYLP